MKLKILFQYLKVTMRLPYFLICLLLGGCVPPVYQNTTYDLEEFKLDSSQIAQGKERILKLENQAEMRTILEQNDSFEDRMIEGDELTILLYYPQRFDHVAAFARINETTGFRVCHGTICLPYLSCIEIEGLTLKEVKEKLQTAYCEELPHAQIFVNFKKRRQRYVQIIGADQSQIPLFGKMRLSEVLAKANISLYANLLKSYVLRDSQQLPVDLYKLIHEGDQSQNIVMRAGDQIFIANLWDAHIMVTGEVPHPQMIPIPYGFISLREALVQAGGIPFTGSQGCIQVIRGNFERPKVYCLNGLDMMHLPNQSLLLRPGDVVVISEKPLTQWNRFIKQIQPSATGVQSTYQTYEQFQDMLN